ncbi:cytochrome P450 [Novosphingobium panipatense]
MNYETADWYSDVSLVDDPHAYFDHLRQRAPSFPCLTGGGGRGRLRGNGAASARYRTLLRDQRGHGRDGRTAFHTGGDDIGPELEAHRKQIAFADQIVAEQGARHADLRSILSRLFTPSRLKQLQPQLAATAEGLIDGFHKDGRVDIVRQYGSPYGALVISDLLGLSEGTRAKFRGLLEGAIPIPMDATHEEMMKNPLVPVGKDLFGLIARRRLASHPLMRPLRRLLAQEDILNDLARATYPDGSRPSLVDVTGLAAFLFGAGQDTTNRLLANGFKVIATRRDIQETLRRDASRIPDFIEELLRYDGSVKSGGRICRKTTTLGGVEIKAGTPILMSHMAANRDPARFPEPGRFDMDRPRIKEHLAFGRGAHTCIGAAGTAGGCGQHRAAARTHGQHSSVGGASRPGRRAQVRV